MRHCDALIVLVYLVLMVGVGLLLARWLKGGRDYFAGGRRIPWVVSGVSLYMTNFSAWMFTGGAALIYQTGWYGILWLLTSPVAYLFAALVSAARWRRSRVISPVEYTRARFGPETQQALGWLLSLVYVLASGVQLLALSVVMQAILGVADVPTLILVNGLVVTAYTLLGGLWAVTMTDMLQFIVLFAVAVVVAPLSVALVPGGLGGLIEGVPRLSLFHVVDGKVWDLHFLLAITISLCAGVAAGQAPRFYCVADERSARRVGLLAAGLFLLSPILFGLPPLVARVLWPDPAALAAAAGAIAGAGGGRVEDQAFLAVVFHILPVGMTGLFLAAMFAATMSSLDSFANITAAIVCRDIVKGLFRPDLDDRTLLKLGRWVTLGVGLAFTLLALVYQWSKSSLLGLMLQLLTLFQAPTSVPVLLGLLSRTIPRRAGLMAVLWGFAAGFTAQIVLGWSLGPQTYLSLGTTVAVLLAARFLKGEYRYAHHILVLRSLATAATFFFLFLLGTLYQTNRWGIPPEGSLQPWRFWTAAAVSLSLGLSLLPFGRYLQRENPREAGLVARFFRRLATPVDPAREAPDAALYRWLAFRLLGLIATAMGLATALLGLVLVQTGRVAPAKLALFLAVAAVEMLLGGIQLLAARRRQPAPETNRKDGP